MEITIKNNIQCYHLRLKNDVIWADIYLDENKNGDGGSLFIRSDYGSWDYFWGHAGCTLKQFLCKIDEGYLVGKLMHGKPDEFDFDRWKEDAKSKLRYELEEKVIDKDKYDEVLTAIDQLDEDAPTRSQDALYVYLRENNSIITKHFNDSEYFPNGEDTPVALKMFIRDLWRPFIEKLKEEIKQTLMLK